MQSMIESEKRVRINNILISEDWAAVHFWNVVTAADGSRDAYNHMQFIPSDRLSPLYCDLNLIGEFYF